MHALNEDRTRFGESMGSPAPDGWPEFPEAIGFTLDHLQSAPAADHAWSMQFFVDPATARLLGSGGFAGRPVDRVVEIGYEIGMVVAEGDLVMVHGRYVGWGAKPLVAIDIFKVKNGKVVEHWDVMQEEVPASATASGNPMFTPA